jgi:hypothetical protein
VGDRPGDGSAYFSEHSLCPAATVNCRERWECGGAGRGQRAEGCRPGILF